MTGKTATMRIGDIPQTVLDDVENTLRHYSVTLLAFWERPSDPLMPLGSGTLVSVGARRFILTAAHVWDELIRAERMHLPLYDGPSFSIPIDRIRPSVLHGGGEWGPDVALLELAESDASTISARKSFVNLVQQKGTLPPDPANPRDCLWAVYGMIGEHSHVDAQAATEHRPKTVTASLRGGAYFSVVRATHEYQGWDYLDLGAKLDLSGVPLSFGGLSGGGLWQIDLNRMKDESVKWAGKRYLRGVAFWQSGVAGERRLIRCHGPRSLFHEAWTAWRLPDVD